MRPYRELAEYEQQLAEIRKRGTKMSNELVAAVERATRGDVLTLLRVLKGGA